MGACQPVTVAGITFATKAALDLHVRQLRDRYRSGESIPPDSEDHRSMLAFIRRQPSYDQKFSAGVARFIVDDDQMGNRCFFFVNNSGMRDDCSFMRCVSGRKNTDQDARVAARIAIVDQITPFKWEWIDRVSSCPECGRRPIDPDTCHVDHQSPATFLTLWQAIRAAHPALNFATTSSNLRPGALQFISPQNAALWASFHRANAKLRLICRTCNLSARRARNEMQ
jgi:Protein of unknown function (DUF3223)